MFARQPEVYAAFVEYAYFEIGRMLKAFDEVGDADNTLVVYIAGDNGTSGGGGQNGMSNEYTYLNGVQEKVDDTLKKMDQWKMDQWVAPRPTRTWRLAGRWRSTARSAG